VVGSGASADVCALSETTPLQGNFRRRFESSVRLSLRFLKAIICGIRTQSGVIPCILAIVFLATVEVGDELHSPSSISSVTMLVRIERQDENSDGFGILRQILLHFKLRYDRREGERQETVRNDGTALS
jgi:hypothetical protein